MIASGSESSYFVAHMRLTLMRVVASALLVGAVAVGYRAVEARRPAPRMRPVAVADGVVLDRRTGLEWTARDHDDSLPWPEADRYCSTLTLGARGGWRLPEVGELSALYDRRLNARCGERECHLDPRIALRGPYVWAATSRGEGTRFYIDFTSSTTLSPGIGPKLVRRVLCVRQASRRPAPT